ncbi:aspartic proteinase NANA, chloroplast-like [Oryza brachyantha]|uniref:aspartic proteinase NANA, chloroplast-like n=1 Tax=Oryza brachyantha TaxID=4533 RepID=UPI001ADCA46F|nr:aspartic proteinase NANA, chloroplast-like [Oryza brachyantha]
MACGKVVLVVLVLVGLAAAASAGGHRSGRRGKSARLQLLPAAPDASLAQRARDDRHRHAHISARLAAARRRRSEETSPSSAGAVAASAFAMPLSSGAYTGTGQYFVRFRVGTPAQPFVLIADTGSDLTWVKCRGDGAAPSASPSHASSPSPSPSPPRVFRPSDSKTWTPIPCSSEACKLSIPFSLANCSSSTAACSYDYRYNDNSAARGVVGTDSATVALSGGRSDRKAKLQGVVLGCTAAYDGQGFEASDGVLSLGYSNISFASRAAARFGGRFSYCLVDHLAPRNATSYLTFGTGPDASSSSASSAAARTPLLLDARVRPFYAVTVDSISVDGVALDIPAEVWDVGSNGGTIIDSGTSLTVLASPAYKAVVAALSQHLAGLPRVTMDPFDFCYNWTSRGGDLAVPVPKLSLQFAGSARLEPPAKSYVIDAAPGVKCIGVQEGAWPGVSVIGNILQQEHLWEFDITNRWLRFRQTRCTQ